MHSCGAEQVHAIVEQAPPRLTPVMRNTIFSLQAAHAVSHLNDHLLA